MFRCKAILVENALEDLLLTKLAPLSKTERLELFESKSVGSFSSHISAIKKDGLQSVDELEPIGT